MYFIESKVSTRVCAQGIRGQGNSPERHISDTLSQQENRHSSTSFRHPSRFCLSGFFLQARAPVLVLVVIQAGLSRFRSTGSLSHLWRPGSPTPRDRDIRRLTARNRRFYPQRESFHVMADIVLIPDPVRSRNSIGLKRRGLQPRLVSSDCLLRRLDKAYNSTFP